MSVCCECCVFLRRGLCDGLITRPEESYRLWCFVVCFVVIVLCVLLSYLYLLYCVGIDLFVLYMPDCWLAVSIRKVLRPATSTQVPLGFLVPKNKC